MKTMKTKLAALLLAVAAVTGVGLVSATPAQAATNYPSVYCSNSRASIAVFAHQWGVYVTAHTPGGSYIAGMSNIQPGRWHYLQTWNRSVNFTVSGPSYSYYTYCA